MARFWVSWYHDLKGPEFELRTPWWESGFRMSDEASTIVAAVEAGSGYEAMEKIVESYEEPRPTVEAISWRFCSCKADDWAPFCTRFPRADWMVWPDPSAAPTPPPMLTRYEAIGVYSFLEALVEAVNLAGIGGAYAATFDVAARSIEALAELHILLDARIGGAS